MRNVLYPKLAATNIKKNGKTYFPYLLTCILTVMMFYDLLLVSTNSALDTMPGASQLRLILNFAVTITGGFSAIFLFYTNSFLVRQRKKEMGLYQVLGMDKTNLTKMMVWESIYTAGAGILGGILAGIVFGRLIFLVLLKLIRFDVAFQFSVEPEAILISAGLFGAIFLVVLIWNIFQVQRVNPVELLQGGKKGEKEPKANWLIAVIGILLLGSGYYIAQTTESPLSAITKFFIAVILVIFGTYALFTAGSVALLKLLKKNKAYYYKTKHFVSVSGLIYRMKQNAVGLANICIMSTIVLVLISATASLYIGQENIMNTRFKTEFSATSDETTPENIQAMERIAQEETQSRGLEIIHEQKYRYVPLSAMKYDNQLKFDTDSGNGYDADAMRKDENLYGTKCIQIPTPQFVIFYNGSQEQPDQKILRLSDAYCVKEENPALELTAVMLNINRGHNEKLKEMCKSLKDYSEYTERVREYAQIKPVEEAVEQAISECIQEGIMAEFLKQNRAEAKQVSIYEYDEEKHMRQEREASWEEGREEGIEEGIKKGKQELLERLIQKKLVKGKSISEIAEELEEEEEVIAEMIQKSVGARK